MMIEKVLSDRLSPVDTIKTEFGKTIKRGHRPVFHTQIIAEGFNEFGEKLFSKDLGHNETVLGGALNVLEKLWDISASLKVASINHLLGINDIVPLPDSSATPDDIVCLWGVGIGGCGDAFGSIRPVHFYEREIGQNGNTDQMIPFRVVNEPFSSTDPNYDKYFMMRKRDDEFYEYYCKAFEIPPVIKVLWKDGAEGEDGTEVGADVYNTTRTDEIETFVEMHCKIDAKDIHEYFEHLSQTEMTRINTIGLFTGRRTELSDGRIDYTNVKLFSKINFDNESLVNAKTILYKYRVYVS